MLLFIVSVKQLYRHKLTMWYFYYGTWFSTFRNCLILLYERSSGDGGFSLWWPNVQSSRKFQKEPANCSSVPSNAEPIFVLIRNLNLLWLRSTALIIAAPSTSFCHSTALYWKHSVKFTTQLSMIHQCFTDVALMSL